jgi:hypothetical protein
LAAKWAAALLLAASMDSSRGGEDAPGGSQGASASAVARADSLLARGAVARAESVYYSTVNARSRDPIARAALGEYLASRGAIRVGVVLLEEARTFGGDPERIALALAPLYEHLGDYASIARLSRISLAPAEADRAAWLVASGTAMRMPDTATVRYRPETESWSLGRVRTSVAGATDEAIIDPSGTRVVVNRSSPVASRLRRFAPAMGDTVFAVADSVELGEVILTNVPVIVAPLQRAQIAIGLGFLTRFAPTFDERRGTLTLRSTGRVPVDSGGGLRLPLLLSPRGGGLRVFVSGRWASLAAPELRAQRAIGRLTVDTRRGQVVFAR